LELIEPFVQESMTPVAAKAMRGRSRGVHVDRRVLEPIQRELAR
jgi:hypothetical protein